MITITVFTIFSFQIAYSPVITESIKSFFLYFIADILLAIVSILFLLFFVELGLYILLTISSTLFFMKRAEKFYTIGGFIFKNLFWAVSNICLYHILDIGKYKNSKDFGLDILIFSFSAMISARAVLHNFDNLKKSK